MEMKYIAVARLTLNREGFVFYSFQEGWNGKMATWKYKYEEELFAHFNGTLNVPCARMRVSGCERRHGDSGKTAIEHGAVAPERRKVSRMIQYLRRAIGICVLIIAFCSRFL